MFAEANYAQWVPWIVALLGSGGVAGAIVMLIKVRPEAGSIAVVASEGALKVQSGVIDTLREDNVELRQRIDAMEEKIERVTERMFSMEQQRDALYRKNEALRKRVAALEKQVRDLGHEPAGNGENGD